jgi:pSer/pThr/pTyr-binding forkhead associated (FHA) protein
MRLTLERYTLYVEDVSLGGGTLLNGKPFNGKQPLHHGDTLQVDDSLFRISCGYFRSSGLPVSSTRSDEQDQITL